MGNVRPDEGRAVWRGASAGAVDSLSPRSTNASSGWRRGIDGGIGLSPGFGIGTGAAEMRPDVGSAHAQLQELPSPAQAPAERPAHRSAIDTSGKAPAARLKSPARKAFDRNWCK